MGPKPAQNIVPRGIKRLFGKAGQHVSVGVWRVADPLRRPRSLRRITREKRGDWGFGSVGGSRKEQRIAGMREYWDVLGIGLRSHPLWTPAGIFSGHRPGKGIEAPFMAASTGHGRGSARFAVRSATTPAQDRLSQSS